MSGLSARQHAMFEFFKIDVHPGRVILTDDPLRAKMMAAHHLENAVLLYENGDELLYFGSYNGTAIALVAVGFDNEAFPGFIREAAKLDVTEVIYIGGCASITDRYPLRTVILADGGCRNLQNRALTAAARCAITAAVRTVASPDGVTGEGIDITDSVTGAFYMEARSYNIKALSILTVSENTKTGEKMEEHERRSRFYAAARLVFETFALKPED